MDKKTIAIIALVGLLGCSMPTEPKPMMIEVQGEMCLAEHNPGAVLSVSEVSCSSDAIGTKCYDRTGRLVMDISRDIGKVWADSMQFQRLTR